MAASEGQVEVDSNEASRLSCCDAGLESSKDWEADEHSLNFLLLLDTFAPLGPATTPSSSLTSLLLTSLGEAFSLIERSSATGLLTSTGAAGRMSPKELRQLLMKIFERHRLRIKYLRVGKG